MFKPCFFPFLFHLFLCVRFAAVPQLLALVHGCVQNTPQDFSPASTRSAVPPRCAVRASLKADQAGPFGGSQRVAFQKRMEQGSVFPLVLGWVPRLPNFKKESLVLLTLVPSELNQARRALSD